MEGEGIPQVVEQHTIDLIVLDILLPGKDGFYWLNWLKYHYPHILVVIASVQTEQCHRVKGFAEGARDYLIKPFHYKELLFRLENIFQHTTPPNNVQRTLYMGHLRFDTKTNTVSKGDTKVRLTQMEACILTLLYFNAGTILSRDDIIEQVRGIKHHPQDRSVDMHINRIRKKIEDNATAPFFIRTVRGKGYFLQLPENSSSHQHLHQPFTSMKIR
jgi:DNA-binding response OmpR family regulator